MINVNYFDKNSLPEGLHKIIGAFYDQDLVPVSVIQHFVAPIKDSIKFVVEYPYVDKVYRDSYYSYFSSKLSKYGRDCIRVSIFDCNVGSDHFFTNDLHDDLKNNYRGFFVVRPTPPSIFGRTTIDKRALKENDFLICETVFSTTCNGLKLSVSGFPYSSQDSETISCAETSLWATMEYFSSRYPKYSSVLPSTIIETLKTLSFQRQLPSLGLSYIDLSYALKKYGFGTMVYDKDVFGSSFNSLLSIYVESGIPLIVAVTNGEGINHAFICCGREKLKNTHLDQADHEDGWIDFHDLKKQFVFIDDNHFPYQRAHLDEPCKYYNRDDWGKCRISHFIVPLYPKVYLDAFEARNYSVNVYERLIGAGNDVIRTMLSSSRSYKNEILQNPDLTEELKEKIVSKPMPKFIWVCEISNKELLKREKCFGSIVLDATEPNTKRLKPLIYCHLGGQVLEVDKGLLYSTKLKKPVHEFSVYTNNLNGF